MMHANNRKSSLSGGAADQGGLKSNDIVLKIGSSNINFAE
jgi:hypothetical protein